MSSILRFCSRNSLDSVFKENFCSAKVNAGLFGLFLRSLREAKKGDALKKISFEPAGCYISASNLKKLTDSCQNISKIDLSNCDVDDHLLRGYGSALSKRANRIESFDLSGNNKLTPSGLQRFVDTATCIDRIDCSRCIRIPNANGLNLAGRKTVVITGNWPSFKY